MARLSKEEHDKIMQMIAEKTDNSQDIMEFIDRLRSDFDESLSVDWEETKKEMADKISAAEGRAEKFREERDRAIGERDESRRQYRERFFGVREEAEQIVNREKKDSPRGLSDVLNIREVK